MIFMLNVNKYILHDREYILKFIILVFLKVNSQIQIVFI